MVSRTYVDQIIKKGHGTSSVKNGEIAKDIVEALCSVTGLSVSTVSSDTTSTYNATIPLPSVNGAINIYNSGGTVYLRVLNENGAVIDSVSSGITDASEKIDGVTNYYTKTRVCHSNLGGVLHSIAITPSAGHSTYFRFIYGWATASQTGENLFFFYLYSGSSDDRYNSMTLVGTPTTTLTLAYNGLIYEPLRSTMPSSTITGVFDASYVWRPIHDFAAIGSVAWFGKILWGGKYTMYALTDTSVSTEMTIAPNVNYVIDGEVYKGLFTRMVDLKE